MAWLHAAPDTKSKNKKPKSRIDTLEEDDPARELPEAEMYIVKCFHLLGICLNGGMGLIALSWTEVNSFCNCSGYPLTGWESEQVIMMSRAYCRMSVDAKEMGCPAPYNLASNDDDAMEVNRKIVNDRFLSMLNAME